MTEEAKISPVYKGKFFLSCDFLRCLYLKLSATLFLKVYIILCADLPIFNSIQQILF